MPIPSNHYFLLAIAAFPKFGPVRLNRIKAYFRSDWEKAFQSSAEELIKAGIDDGLAREFVAVRSRYVPEKLAEACDREDIGICLYEDDDYPRLLKQIANPPVMLYHRGNMEAVGDFGLAIVGSRKCTAYGRQAAERLATDLSRAGLTVISGLALGIDTYAHSSTLTADGKTVAVLGCGLDWASFYPSANRRLAQAIIAGGGAIISEFPLGMAPLQFNFPQRNRIVSGMSRGTLVIEANEKSGALITADYALEQNREVFALPGNIYSPQSAGPNRLIKKGAIPVTCADDILEALNLEHVPQMLQSQKIIPKTAEEGVIAGVLSHEPMHINDIVRLTRLDTSVINSTLTIMEMKGLAKNMGGMKYILAS